MSDQYLRKASLVVIAGEKALDLSELRFIFETKNADSQSPDNCSIRVYNLSDETSNKVQKEFTRVVLSAGYQNGPYGIIFDGTIKQFRRGRESATDDYLDILAADGDIGYNFGVVSNSLPAGSTPRQRVDAAIAAMPQMSAGSIMDFTGGILPRGKVQFGMARDFLRRESESQGGSWSVQSGKIQIVPLEGYLPGDAVQLNSLTGMIGVPEQTDEGVKVTCLLNPKIRIGGLVQINNKDINKTIQANPDAAPIPFNQWTGIQLLAKITTDGYYRVYACEHTGDTRGAPWYSTLICLAFAKSSNLCTAA